MGGAYDVFGNGKTAIKVSMSKYLQAAYAGEVYTVSNPGVTLVQSTTRGWDDRTPVAGGIPNDFIPQCDFLNAAKNGECQAWGNLNWGKQGQTTTVNPAVQEGWNKRNWDWQFSAGRPARDRVEGLRRRQLQPSVVGEFLRHAQPRDYRERLGSGDAHGADRLTLPGGGGYPVTFLTRNANSALGVTDNLLHDDEGLWRRDALLARRRRIVQRALCPRAGIARWHQHRSWRQRYLRGRNRPVRPCAAHGQRHARRAARPSPS